MTRRLVGSVLFIAAWALLPALYLENPEARQPSAKPFQLTVDSIMRGPDLVGYAPSGLRWSADSSELYFEWRKPGEDEASTYAVGRGGGEAPSPELFVLCLGFLFH